MKRRVSHMTTSVLMVCLLLGCKVANQNVVSPGSTASTAPPTVTYTTPLNGATGFPVNRSITVIFSKTMKVSTLTRSTFFLSGPSSTVTGTVFPSGSTAVFTPATDLASNAIYTATVTTGVTDQAGNPLASNYVWSFSTGSVIDLTRPTVNSTNPANNAVDIAVNGAVTVNFSEAMDPATITSSTFIVSKPSGSIGGTVTPNGAIATFTPSTPLDYSTTYSALITTGAKDLAGNALASNFTWSFTTGVLPDTTPPNVTAVSPVNGATAVALNSAVSVAFNEAIDPATITQSVFVLTGPSGTVNGTVTPSGNSCSFKPSANLSSSATYTATLLPGVQDLAGNAMTTGYSWIFSTGTTTDTTPPTVLDVTPHDPLSTSNGVALNSAIAACFSEPVDPATITSTSFAISSALGTPYTSSLLFNYNCITYVPTQDYSSQAYVHVDISTAVKDMAGNALSPWAYQGAFRPAGTYEPHYDTTPPTVFSKYPADGATGAALGNIRFNLDEPVFPPSISSTSFSAVGPGGPVPGTFKIYGTTASFIPSAPLAQNALYTITATTGVQDLSRNGLTGNNVWSFTTATVDQSGTPGSDTATGIAVDGSGNYYVTGYTDGGLDGNTNLGMTDGFLIKYNPAGVKQWTRQFGTANTDWANAVTVDASGSVFVAGTTLGNVTATQPFAFLKKFDSSGNLLWTRQNTATSGSVGATSVAVDVSGNIYVAGSTTGSVDGVTGPGGQDIILIKYDSTGTWQWTTMYGTASTEDCWGGVKTDSLGNVYVAGSTWGGSFGGPNQGARDTFVFKVDANGNSLWVNQLGSAVDDWLMDMAIDASDNVYIAGVTGAGSSGFDGQTGIGQYDAILIKYNASGVKQWTRQLGTVLNDHIQAMAIDSSGNFYLTGFWDTTVSFYSTPTEDAFVNRYDSTGLYQWTKPIGSQGKDTPVRMVISPTGHVALCGTTTGSINGNTNHGGNELFFLLQ